MRQTVLVLLMLYLASFSVAVADDPYLDPLCEAKRTDPRQCLEQFKYAPQGIPPGGYLYRFKLDVIQDETPELFTSSSIISPGGWTVFSLDGETPQLLGRIGLPANGFYLQDEGSGSRLLTKLSALDLRRMFIVQYRFTNSSIERVTKEVFPKDQAKNPDGTYMSLKQMAEKKGFVIGGLVTPQVEKILLQKYLTDPDLEWKRYVPSLMNEWQHQDPEDEEDLEDLEMTALQVFEAIPLQ